jgi:hypothetical protein
MQPFQEAYRETIMLPIPARVIVAMVIIPIVVVGIIGAMIIILIVIAAAAAAAVALLLTVVPVWLILDLGNRWLTVVVEVHDFDTGIMKVPTFYSFPLKGGEARVTLYLLSITGVVFGGIHCTGWFFTFPSSDEAILWRVSSVVLTGIAFFIPSFIRLPSSIGFLRLLVTYFAVITYVLSRLILLVEAFISLRHLTLGMLAVVKWTSFIPHI